MVGSAQHHDCAAFGERDDKAGRPGYAVRMNNNRLYIVERHPPLFLTIKTDNQKSAIRGQVKIIRGNINNAVHGQPFGVEGWHIMDNDWLTRSRIKDTTKFVDTNLASLDLL